MIETSYKDIRYNDYNSVHKDIVELIKYVKQKENLQNISIDQTKQKELEMSETFSMLNN